MSALDYSIPDHWIEVKLGDVLNRISNGTTAKQNMDRIGIPVTRIETISKETVDLDRVRYITNPSPEFILKYKLEKGDILFSHINSDLHLGKTAIFKLNLTVLHGMNLLLIRPKGAIISPDYLNYLFNFYRHSGVFISIAQHAVNQSSINQRKMKQLNIPLAPYNEQVHIVGRVEELLSRLDAGVQSLQVAQTQLEQYRQTNLKQAYTGKLTQKWRHENPDNEPSSTLIVQIKRELGKLPPQRFTPKIIKLEKLSELPDKWSWVQIGEVFYIILGQSPPSSTYNEINKGLPFFQGSKEFRERYPIIKKWCSKPKKIAEKNDVLISVRAPVGDVNIAPEKCCIGRGLSAIRALAGVKPLYVYHLIEFIRSDLKSKGTGSTFNAITGDVLRSQIIPLPPLDEIDVIVENIEMSFSIFKRIENNLNQNIRKCERMKLSILKKAFEGRLVPQDPNDEPASLLLERIKAQKVNQGKLR